MTVPTTLEMDGISPEDLPFMLVIQCRSCANWTEFEKDAKRPTRCECGGWIDHSSIRSKRTWNNQLKPKGEIKYKI